MRETRKLLSQSELRGLAQDLAPATRDLARLTDASLKLLPEVNDTSRCARDVVLPTGDIVVHDEFDHRRRELQGVLVDDGRARRARARTSTATAPTCASRPAAARTPSRSARPDSPTGQLVGSSPAPVLGVRPKYPGKRPPYNSSVPCYKSKIPNVNGPLGRARAG